MESYYESKKNYNYWKKQCSDDIMLGLNEETDIGKFDVMMYNEHQNTLLSEISEVKYQILIALLMLEVHFMMNLLN